MSSARGLVIGFASNLPAEPHFLPFLRSLRLSGYEGRVCVFVSNVSAPDQQTLGQIADDVVAVDDEYPALAPRWSTDLLGRLKVTRGPRRFYPRAYRALGSILRARQAPAVSIDLEFRLQGVQALRYGHYLDYLEQHPEVDKIMISDLRDVLFQADPLSSEVAGLEVFLEEPHVRFDAPGFNRSWIKDLYGTRGLRRLGDAVVSCSGVTVGRRDPMLRYLAAMAGEVGRHTDVPLGPHDQAIHNWLLYTGALPNATVVPNGQGRTLTMGAQREVYLRPDGMVVRQDGTIAPVLHQYDRHSALASRLVAAVAEEFDAQTGLVTIGGGSPEERERPLPSPRER